MTDRVEAVTHGGGCCRAGQVSAQPRASPRGPGFWHCRVKALSDMRYTVSQMECCAIMAKLKATFTDVNGTVHEVHDIDAGLSLMEVAKAHGVAGIMGDCGG